MRHTLEALVNLQESTDSYIVKFTPLDGGVQLLTEVEWDAKRHGKDLTYRAHFILDAAPDAAKAVRWVMGGTLGACLAINEEASALAAACSQLQKAADEDNKTLEDLANRKEELDGDIALKGAALLAAKQEKLLQLLERAENEDLMQV